MKKIKSVMASLLIAGVMGVSSSASAEGELNGEWFNTRIKTNVKKNHALVASASSVVFNNSPIPFDSGKDVCFSALNWHGAGTRQYDFIVICNVQGTWQSLASIGDIPGLEYDDGSVAVFANSPFLVGGDPILLLAEGQTGEGVFFTGTLYLKTSFKSDGSLKNVKLLQPADGTNTYVLLSPSNTTLGSTGPGLKMKRVDSSLVPAEAKACLGSVLGTGPAVPNCL